MRRFSYNLIYDIINSCNKFEISAWIIIVVILPFNSYTLPDYGLIVSWNVCIQLSYRLLNISLCLTEEWSGLLSCFLPSLFPSCLPSFLPVGHDNLHFTGGILRPVHTEKGRVDSKFSCLASIMGVSCSNIDQNVSYRAWNFRGFPQFLQAKSRRVFHIRSR
jgi:hypothetical protein